MSEIKFRDSVAMPLLALRGVTVFPSMMLHFDVGRDKSKKALEAAMNRDQTIFLLTQKDMRVDDPREADLYRIGTVSKVKQMLKLPGGGIRVLVEGISRGVAERFTSYDPYIESYISVQAPIEESAGYDALVRFVRRLYEEYADLNPYMGMESVLEVISSDKPGYLADYITQNSQMEYAVKQQVLEELDPIKRLNKVCTLLSEEMEILRAENKIQEKVKEQLDRNQKDYVLREQLKAIKNELGEGEDAPDGESYEAKIEKLISDSDSKKKLLKDVTNLKKYGQNMSESALIRAYLDTVLELPWGKKTKERLDVARASKILDADHYGLDKVKDRILEYIAVRALSPELKNQIICLVGPPGVGKTSVAMSVAKAMDRKLARVSLGGVRDEAEIRGHRKTYIGAMPGRIINGIRQAGSMNPVLLLDEIDKLGADYKGDPSSALLEVLDSEQNHSFRDHYLEIPFDLSDVMFIMTANDAHTIPHALLDRMEIIELSSYTEEEKLNIAREHLIPKQLKRHGLNRRLFRINDDTVRFLIDGYTREAGVRTLERTIASCCRKAAREFAENPELKSITVTDAKLVSWLGPKKFKRDEHVRENRIGSVNGLAWTSVGGELLEAEVNILNGSGKVELTGNLGNVMKESASAAISFIRSRADKLNIDPEFYKNKDIHVHFPEGAIPKDGPSAGITIATAIISALTDRAVMGDVAMTGEITLRGRVLPIGGLKEKSMAAFRAGITKVIIPFDNEPDLYEIDKTVRDAIRFYPVKSLDEVISIALEPDLKAEEYTPVESSEAEGQSVRKALKS